MKDVKLIVCSECFTVKAVLVNTFGDTSYCKACGKSTKFLHLDGAEFYVLEDPLISYSTKVNPSK